jgi:hypothetical protein
MTDCWIDWSGRELIGCNNGGGDELIGVIWPAMMGWSDVGWQTLIVDWLVVAKWVKLMMVATTADWWQQ